MMAAVAGCARASAPLPATAELAGLPSPIGAPQLSRAEGEVEYRRYRVGPCQLDLFLSDAPSGTVTLDWLDARPAREADPALGSACSELAARLRGRSLGELL